MSDPVPDWLATALGLSLDGAGGLAAARLAGAQLLGAGGLTLRSAAFADGEPLDPSFTADEEDAVAPPLEWSAPPEGTAELALLVECPDAGSAQPQSHWLVWGLAPQRGKLLEGETPPRAGKNAAGNSEWLLPAPPAGAPPQHYVFQLFALDAALSLRPGAGREDLLSAMAGHVLAVALLTASYARSDDEDWDDDGWDDAEGEE